MQRRLMTPGPTQVPEAARLALARQVIYHRSAEFKALFAEVLADLKYVFQTQNDVVVLTASGTGGMEAAVVNLVPRGGKAIVLEAGVFARRWSQICGAYGIEVVRLEVPWGQAVRPAEVAQLLSQHPDAVAVFGTLLESSTGVVHDIEAIGRVVKSSGPLWGVFARRWSEICRAYGIEVVRLEVPWGQAVPPAEVAQLLSRHPDTVAVFGTLLESSTGVVHDIEAIGRVVKSSGPLWVVDAISGAGAIECRTDAWGIDVLVVGSQKALMLPPGLAMLAASAAAWQQMERIAPQAFYFNLCVHRKLLASGPETPWTPAIGLVVALAENLRAIRAEGIEQIWQRNERMARATRAGVQALGLELFAARPAGGLTAVRIPAGVAANQFLARLESRFGVKLAGGQAQLQGKIFRIGHFGAIDELDILATLAALEAVLVEFGHAVQSGAAVSAAGRELSATEGEKSAGSAARN